jgi:hypothetical protein
MVIMASVIKSYWPTAMYNRCSHAIKFHEALQMRH